jgi:hypothetical protein
MPNEASHSHKHATSVAGEIPCWQCDPYSKLIKLTTMHSQVKFRVGNVTLNAESGIQPSFRQDVLYTAPVRF